jgi:tRNA(fMet)-specific endonuclease VapC
MRYMLDTNILIYLLKNNPPSVAKRVNQLEDEDDLCMSYVTWAELLLGAKKSNQHDLVMARLKAVVKLIPVIYPNNGLICEHYAEQFTRLKKGGTPIGGNDLWIACHALAVNATLVTHNTKEFKRVKELTIEDWAK